MADSSKKPDHQIRLGSVTASLWQHDDGGDKAWWSVAITKLYKDGEQWQRTTNFSRDDLLLVAKVADMAHTYACQNPAGKGSD